MPQWKTPGAPAQEEEWGAEEWPQEDWEEPKPPTGPPPKGAGKTAMWRPGQPLKPLAAPKAGAFQRVKQESWNAGDDQFAPRPGETERQAKIRIETAKLRSEFKRQKDDADMEQTQREVKRKTADSMQEKRKEAEDTNKLERLLASIEPKLTTAEDEAEKVSILAAPLAMEAVEELRELQLGAIRDTERALKAATTKTNACKRDLEKFELEIEGYADSVKETASAELAKFNKRIEGVTAKLNEHRTVRKDHELALNAEKFFGELAQRLAGVEIDCEKAAMMVEPIAKALDVNPSGIGPVEIRETKEALRVATATLAPTVRLIAGKVEGLKGPIRVKMLELQDRAEAAQTMIETAQKTVDEAQSRAAALPLLKQAAERVATVEEVLQKMRETETPFLMGIETLPAEEAGEMISKMDRAAALASSAIADAHKYVALKMVEVGRLAEGAAENARAEMDRAKQQLDVALERVRQFQAEALKRKRLCLVDAIKSRVEDAEAAVARMKDAGADLQAATAETLAEKLESAHVTEIEAQNKVTMARRELQEKQQSLGPLDGKQPDVLKSSSELMRTKVRVNYMEAELGKFRKLAKDLEDKAKVEKSLAQTTGGLQDAEAEIERLHALTQVSGGEALGPEEDKAISVVQSKLSATTKQVEVKLRTAQGVELKELRNVFGRLQRSQWKLDRVKESIRERSRSQSKGVISEAASAVHKAEAKVAAVSGTAKGLDNLAIGKLEQLYEDATAAIDVIAEAQKALAKGQAGGLLLEAKVEFARLQLRCKAAERKGRSVFDTVGGALERVSADASGRVLDALRTAARREDSTYDPDSLFAELSDGAGQISERQLLDFFAKHQEDLGISTPVYQVAEEKVSLAFKKIAPHGLTQRVFASALADFFRCIRDITVTDEFMIQSAKKVRKLQVGELVEAVGGSQEDMDLGLERVQCRAVTDGTTGWITIRSTAGTTYLERATKPFLYLAKSTGLRGALASNSKRVRELKAGESVELVEGPKEERSGSDTRVRGAACGEEAQGWLQITEKGGVVLAKLSAKVYKCIEAIAMTDAPDFGKCQMVRRIDAGEALELLDDKIVKPDEGGMRRRFRACRDGREGWITTHGSQGTVYTKAATRHYVIQKEAPVHAGLSAESPVVRVLMPGEAFAAFEDPKEVSGGEQLTFYKVRAVTDGAEGWVTSGIDKEVRPWSASYKVLRSVPLTRTLSANEAAEVQEIVRTLEQNEILHAAEHPIEDSSTGQLRLRVVATSDKAPGWATVREGTALLLRPATADEVQAAAKTVAAADDVGSAAPSTPPAGPQKRPAPAPLQVKEEYPGYFASAKRQKGAGKGKGKW